MLIFYIFSKLHGSFAFKIINAAGQAAQQPEIQRRRRTRCFWTTPPTPKRWQLLCSSAVALEPASRGCANAFGIRRSGCAGTGHRACGDVALSLCLGRPRAGLAASPAACCARRAAGRRHPRAGGCLFPAFFPMCRSQCWVFFCGGDANFSRESEILAVFGWHVWNLSPRYLQATGGE